MIKTRSRLIVISILSVSAMALYAKGPELSPAEGLENWKYELDLSAYASGKYNLVVEGVDKAGNITRAAPMNIYVDPKSGFLKISNQAYLRWFSPSAKSRQAQCAHSVMV